MKFKYRKFACLPASKMSIFAFTIIFVIKVVKFFWEVWMAPNAFQVGACAQWISYNFLNRQQYRALITLAGLNSFLSNRKLACANSRPIEENSTGATLCYAAPILSAYQLEMIPKYPKHWCLWINIYNVLFTVYI